MQIDHRWMDDGWCWALRGVVPLVVLLVIGGLVVWAVVRLSTRPSAPAMSLPPVPPAPSRDPALEELRLRYARGDIAREEFLQRSRDLGGGGAAPDDGPTPDPS